MISLHSAGTYSLHDLLGSRQATLRPDTFVDCRRQSAVAPRADPESLAACPDAAARILCHGGLQSDGLLIPGCLQKQQPIKTAYRWPSPPRLSCTARSIATVALSISKDALLRD